MSASAEMKRLPKPQMRGLLKAYISKHLAIATVLGFAGSMAWKFLVADPRKRAYAEFYKTYDGDKDYERMKNLGILPPFPQFEKEEE